MDPEQPLKKLCTNCHTHIKEHVFVQHEIHCRKCMVYCAECDIAIRKTELEAHNEEEHTPLQCDLCGEMVPKEEIESHKENSCPEYRIDCSFCELDIARKDYHEHVEGCGARTDLCELCNQRVMLKDRLQHNLSNCATSRSKDTHDQNTRHQLQEVQAVYFDEDFQAPLISRAMGYDYLYPSQVPTKPPLSAMGMGHDYLYPSQVLQTPKPPLSALPSEENSMHVDPQWLASVADACGEENIDQILAQNMGGMLHTHTDTGADTAQHLQDKGETVLSKVVPLDYGYPHVREQHPYTDRQGEGAHIEKSYSYEEEDRLGGEFERLDMEKKDAEMARQIFQRDFAYAQRGAKDGGEIHANPSTYAQESGAALARQSEKDPVYGYEEGYGGEHDPNPVYHDAEYAKQLHEKEVAYVEHMRRDAELARQMQEEEKRFSASSHYLEQERFGFSDYSRSEMPKDTESYAREIHEREVSKMEHIKRDEELARQVQEEEENKVTRFNGGNYYDEQEYKVSQDSDSSHHSLERDSCATRTSKSQQVNEAPFLAGYEMSDKYWPRAKTPPPMVELPCERAHKHQQEYYSLGESMSSPTHVGGDSRANSKPPPVEAEMYRPPSNSQLPVSAIRREVEDETYSYAKSQPPVSAERRREREAGTYREEKTLYSHTNPLLPVSPLSADRRREVQTYREEKTHKKPLPPVSAERRREVKTYREEKTSHAKLQLSERRREAETYGDGRKGILPLPGNPGIGILTAPSKTSSKSARDLQLTGGQGVHPRPHLEGKTYQKEDSGPCENCRKHFAVKDLVKHESTCEFLSKKRRAAIAAPIKPVQPVPTDRQTAKASSKSKLAIHFPSKDEANADSSSAQKNPSSYSSRQYPHNGLPQKLQTSTSSLQTSTSSKAKSSISEKHASQKGKGPGPGKLMVHGIGMTKAAKPAHSVGSGLEEHGGASHGVTYARKTDF